MKIGVSHNLGDAAKTFSRLGDDSGKALADAMNTTVHRAQFNLVAQMRQVFNNPTPYVLDGLRTDLATPKRLQAAVMVRGKQDGLKGDIPAESILKAEIEGGARRWKRSELALQRVGVMPQGWYAIPAKGARLDGYGNMSRGQVTQILSWFEAFPESMGKRGFRANSTEKSRAKRRKSTRRRAGYEYFAVQPGNKGLRPGIYLRMTFGLGKGVTPLLVFVSKSTYRKRLDFFGTVQRSFEETLEVQIRSELDRVE